nr:hypothetical protein POPTR_016G052400 [Ipomoea trifida]GMD23087.1 hypothetical protein POPTR_016G052400 [Ipomoea batatas]
MAKLGISEIVVFSVIFMLWCLSSNAAAQELDLAPAPAPGMDSGAGFPATGYDFVAALAGFRGGDGECGSLEA